MPCLYVIACRVHMAMKFFYAFPQNISKKCGYLHFYASIVKMKFTIAETDPRSKARAGLMETGSGPVETPIFMPVGTVVPLRACTLRI